MIRINAPAEPLLTVGELAGELKRAESYVWAMRRRGFKMPGGRAKLSSALRFLEKNPKPRGSKTSALS